METFLWVGVALVALNGFFLREIWAWYLIGAFYFAIALYASFSDDPEYYGPISLLIGIVMILQAKIDSQRAEIDKFKKKNQGPE